jgi:TatD DNase family protein
MIGDNFPCTVILHWFSGSKKYLEKGLNFGFYFSVNSAMLQSANGLDIVRSIPSNRLLTESDGPFVTTAERTASPLDMETIVGQIAKIKQISYEEMSEIVFGNFLRALDTTKE